MLVELTRFDQHQSAMVEYDGRMYRVSHDSNVYRVSHDSNVYRMCLYRLLLPPSRSQVVENTEQRPRVPLP